MVYKKYVKKRGKVFGPYYYSSYREGNSVKKVYIGGEEEFREYLRNEKKVEQSLKLLLPLKTRTKVVRGIYLLLLFFFIFGAIFLLFGYDNFKIKLDENNYYKIASSIQSSRAFVSGYAVEEFYDENAGLKIQESPKIGDSFLSANKNKRMDFDINGGLRLYFDLLNYTDYVEKTAEKLVEKNVLTKEDLLKNNTENLSEGFIVDGFSINNLDVNKVKNEVAGLDENELREIENKAVVEAEDFDIKMNEAEADNLDVDYKWQYNVKLNDLNFISKVDITSDNDISIIDDSSLRIGNNILSFKDLIEEGYKIKISRPSLDLTVKENEINNTEEKIKDLINLTKEIRNESFENKSGNLTKEENDSKISNESQIRDIELIEVPDLNNKNLSEENKSSVSGSAVKEIENKNE